MKTNNNQEVAVNFKQRFIEAMQKLQNLGARMTSHKGNQVMYVPGTVRFQSVTPVDLYGAVLASRGRGHKSFLRKNNLGKFKKSK